MLNHSCCLDITQLSAKSQLNHLIPLLLQGLKANVLRQFEETAALRAQQKHENQDSDGRGRTNSAGIMDMASKR